ncbi:hypothetical protein Tsubulata_001579 [Turnera subulata]|uniref:DUF4283 domain-containing protein n=1 Tax=Turnera subulata TaxID=218843 RepID=A0A9Q0IWC7_9ROSI|nr:hypothetical protein Tsubulata_001579 [Turnera subulata]
MSRSEPLPATVNGDSDHREGERSNKKVRRREEEQTENMILESPKLSYRNILNSGHEAEEQEIWDDEDEPEVEDGDIIIAETEGGPVMKLSESFKSRLRKPWESVVVIKLMGKRIGYRVLRSKIQSLWKPQSPFRLIDLENDFFVVRFKDKTDALQALLGGPWAVFGHALMVQPWTPEFRAVNGVIEKATVWVRFMDIPLDWYHTKVLLGLGNMVGRAMKIDERTTSTDRGKFAKVAVVVDLTKPLKGVVTVEEEACQSCVLFVEGLTTCESLVDLERVVTKGPWLVHDHYLTVRQWFPTFRPDSDHIVKTMAWVRLPGLPLMYYDDDLLSTFATAIGTPVRIDSNTSQATRALYARMCVEVDLSQPLVPLVSIQDEVFKVQYEGLHTICLNCGRFGHKTVHCQFDTPNVPIAPAESVEPENAMDLQNHGVGSQVVMRVSESSASAKRAHFGEWMMVSRPPRRVSQQRAAMGGTLGSSPTTGNRFSALETDEVVVRAPPAGPTLNDFITVGTCKPKRVRPTNPKGKKHVSKSAEPPDPGSMLGTVHHVASVDDGLVMAMDTSGVVGGHGSPRILLGGDCYHGMEGDVSGCLFTSPTESAL